MAILDFTTAPSNAPSSNGRRMPFAGQTTTATDQPNATLWMNIGYDIETVNEAGETVKRFINLPFGLPIDTMREVETRGQNEDYVKQQHARNGLLKHLQTAGAQLKPGQEVVVALTVKLRRVKDELAVVATNNEYIADLSDLLIAAE